jgi:hypothetical protein
MDERAFGKAAEPHALKQANAVAAQARRIRWTSQCCFRVLALEGMAGLASSAPSARLCQRPYNVISNTELRDVGADPRDDA